MDRNPYSLSAPPAHLVVFGETEEPGPIPAPQHLLPELSLVAAGTLGDLLRWYM